MSEEYNEKSFFVNWPIMLIYAGRFGKVIDNLEAVGCFQKGGLRDKENNS